MKNMPKGGWKVELVANAKEPGAVDKRQLMEEVAEALHSLDGSVYTGCDMNTDFKDMKYLSELCPYVLASLESTIDANKSTAHGVVGAVALHCRFQISNVDAAIVPIGERSEWPPSIAGAAVLSADL